MTKLKTVLAPIAVLLVVLAGCRGMTERPVAPADTTLSVMTYNVYVGGRTDALLATTDLSQIPVRVAEMHATVLASDFPGRAAAIAGIVKESQPHLIGLQEISLLRMQEPTDSLVNPQPNAETVTLDFLEVLQAALLAEGMSYLVAGKVENFDIEMPMLTDTGLVDVRLTDYDVILARSDVTVANPMSVVYRAKLPIPHIMHDVPRGYVAVDATVAGVTYRVVNTHLESVDLPAGLPQPRLEQAKELIANLSAETRPVILLGDFNTQAPEGAAYQLLLEAGYRDVWQADSAGTGNTCCQAADLQNAESVLYERIDQIFIKGVSLRQGAAIRTATVGDQAAKRTPAGLWPSDHAGVIAHLPVE